MIGQRLGTFLIEAELGSGMMGTVYRGVRETGKPRIAAIKVIGAEQMAKGKAFERFLREIEILQKLRHANIVRYMAHGKSGKTYYYAMEYIYEAVFPGADASLTRNDAARRWRERAARLENEGAKSERGWRLFAKGKAADIEAKIADRTLEIARLIEQADDTDRESFPDQALEIRRDLLDRFGKYTDTVEALTPGRKILPADKRTAAGPG